MGQRGFRRSAHAGQPVPVGRRGGATFIDEQKRQSIGAIAKWAKGSKPWVDWLLEVASKRSGPW
eukprot:5073415-Lingulodinium_polyedra.AAC.1